MIIENAKARCRKWKKHSRNSRNSNARIPKKTWNPVNHKMSWMRLNQGRLIKLNLMGLAPATLAIDLSVVADLIPPLLKITLGYLYVIVGFIMFIQVYRAQVIIVEKHTIITRTTIQ